PGGYVLRSLHSPFGDGRNVIFVGGSDDAGVATAARALVKKLSGKPGDLTVGWLSYIKLSPDYALPADFKQADIWEASEMYGSSGYFGWNMISKLMALYYMTGDEKYLKEFMRLSFPDAAAIKEIEDGDGERIENKTDPLAGPYHYSAHMMIVLWDLIEESPFFTDEQRLKITNAFARQLTHRVVEGVYGRTEPQAGIGDRHGDWAAFSLYVLGRYFNKDYPEPVWQRSLEAADQYFNVLKRTYWMAGNNDHLFWFTSYYDPMLNYLLMTGRRDPDMLANLRRAFETQEILFTGRERDTGLKASALSMLNKAAYILGDGRWLWYRGRINLNQECLRLGQSFWPGPDLKPAAPADQIGKWNIHWMSEDMWKARATGFPQDQSFRWGAYRSEPGPAGDYLMIDGYNGAGRNPYHTFDILELRLNGATLLSGYNNQVLSSADGMVEPQVAMDGRLLHHDVLGQTTSFVGEVPKLAFANWQRSLAQRVGRYAVVVDDLGFRTDSENIKVQTTWQMPSATWLPALNLARVKAYGAISVPEGWLNFPAIDATCACGPGTPADLLSRLASIDIMLLKAQGPGTWIEMLFELKQRLTGEVFADLLNYEDRGIVRLYLDGKQVGDDVDHYAGAVATTRVSLGIHDLAAGTHRLKVEVVGKRPEAKKYFVGLTGVKIRPEGAATAAPQVTYELHTSELMDVSGGGIITMEWRGAARNGQHRRFFHLLGANPTGSDDGLACLQVAENAAALAVPEAGVVSCGDYKSNRAQLAILTEKSAYAQAARTLGLEETLLDSDVPVDVDWDFEKGVLNLSGGGGKLWLALQSPEVKIDGNPVKLKPEGKMTLITLANGQLLPAGRHVITGATPSTAAWKPLTASLPALLTQARQKRAEQVAARAAKTADVVAEMKPASQAQLGGKPLETIVIPSPAGDQLCTAVGKDVIILDATGKEVRRLSVAGNVMSLRWWTEPKLLLVGCADEKVVAFDEQGARKWDFTSIMDHAVYEAGKQYWFKSAAPGVHGLYSGPFDDGKSRAFVGSACTLEILDETGQLVKRLPVFWGPGRKFLLTDAADGSKNLLVARWHNDGHALAIINSKQMGETGRGFDGVPSGHTYVGGWDCMNREDNYYVDLDGDGKREVVSAINGTWNRITVFSEAGAPLYNAQFGSGVPTARENLRMMDVADLNGDGKQEIVVGISAGLVVCLDNQTKKLWSRQLASPPTVVRPVPGSTPWLLVGCQDGTTYALDGKGQVLRQGKMSGRAVDARVLQTPSGPLGVIVTDSGAMAGFRL
ncbi:MAG: VCBS repeat-containing protein, partial [Armatimonadia bacterium]